LEVSNKSGFPLYASICEWCHLLTVEKLPFFSIEHLPQFHHKALVYRYKVCVMYAINFNLNHCYFLQLTW
jgi:hypothetical protein